MAAPFSRALLARLLSRLNQYTAPVWTVAPAVTAADAGANVTYTGGTVTGYPEPTVTYLVLVDDVSVGPPPYEVQQSDVGKTIKIRGIATNTGARLGVTQDSAGYLATGAIRASISATGEWLDENGTPLVLRGVNQGTWGENFEPDAAAIKALGATAVRLVGVRWWGGDGYGAGVDSYDPDPENFYLSPTHRAQMLQEVAWLEAQGIWIGFVFDSDNGAGKMGLGNGTPNFFEESAEGATKFAEWKVMVRSVVQDLLAFDRILYFEPLAEPLQHDSNSSHNELVRNVYRELMDNIREVDARTPFLIGPRASYGANFLEDIILPERNDYAVTCDYLTGKVNGEGTINSFTESLRTLRLTYNVGLFQQQVGRETVGDIGDVNADGVGDTTDNVGYTGMCGVLSSLNAHNIPYTWWQWHQNTDNAGTYALHYKLVYPGPTGPDNWVPKPTELAIFEYHMRQTGDWVEDEAIAAATSVAGGLLFDPAPSNCFTDAAGTIPASAGQKVRRINAVVGDGFASQNDNSLAPTLVATVNGYALQFSAAAGTYLNINTSYFADGDSGVVIAAGRPTASGSARVMFHCGNSSTTVRNPYLAITSSDLITASWRGDDNVNRASDSTTTCDGRAIVATAYRSGSSKKVNAQGVQEGSNGNAVGSMATITRARWGSSSTGANNFDGPMSLLFLGKSMSDAQCHAIERRGAWKEGAPFRAAIPVLSIVASPVLTATNGRTYTGFTSYGFNGVQPYTYSLIGTLPTGLSLNTSTGAITGTPTQTGTFAGLGVTVTDDNDDTASLSTFSLTVAAAVGISGTPVLTATSGTAYTGFTASATGGTAPITYAKVGTWPTGLNLNTSTGQVSGTPTQTGSFAGMSISATDAHGSTASLATFTLVVSAAVGISGTPVLTATNGRPYTGFDVDATGGTAPIVYAKVGTWPTGLNLNTSTGVVSGTPSQSGSFAGMSVSATDAHGSTASLSTFTMVVAAAVGVSGTPVLTADDGLPYAGFDVNSTGGTAPITFALVGTWPDGITIDSLTGVVSGTTSELGAFASLSVSATDVYGSTASLATFTLTVSEMTAPTLEDMEPYQTTATRWRNIPYGEASWTEPGGSTTLFQRLDVDLPSTAAPAGGYAVIVYFHPNGSTKTVSAGSTIEAVRTAALAANIAFVSVEFRHPVTNVSEGAPHEDAGLAIQYIRGLADAFNFDKTKVGAVSRSRGSVSLWQALQPDMLDAGAVTWQGRQSSLLQAVWSHNAQTTYSTTEFANLFIVEGAERTTFLTANPDDVRWGSAIQDIATAPSVPMMTILHQDAYPTGYVNANQVNEHYSGFGSAFEDACIAAGHGAKITAQDSVPAASSYVGAVDWFEEIFYPAPAVETYGSLGLNGTNVGPNWDYQTRVFVNLLHSLRCWCPIIAGLPYDNGFGYGDVTLVTSGAQKGYPAAGQSCIGIFLNVLTSDDYGAYLFECDTDMTAKIVNNGEGSFNGTLSYNAGTGKTTGTLTVSSGTGVIALRFNNVNSGFGGLKLHAPGYALNTTQKIRTEALAHFDFASVLRFMDWLNTNGPEAAFDGGGNQQTDWIGSWPENSDSARGYKNSLQACYDFAEELDNRPLAVNIPALFTDSAIHSFIDECAALQSADANQITYVECPGNEPWNANLGESTTYFDLRDAAFTEANVRGGPDITSITRSGGNLITVVFDEPHLVTGTPSIYVKHKTDLFTAGTETATVVNPTTITWVDAGSNGSISHADDDTYIFLNPSHTLCRNIGYHQPDPNTTANYVRIRYELSRARVAWERVDAIDQSARIKIIYGSWTAQPLNYVPCLLWALEEYGDLDWLHAVATAFYVEHSGDPATIDDVAEVFSRMDTYVVDVKDRMLRWCNLAHTLGISTFWYEWGPHLHLDGGNSTARAAIVASHSDAGMGTRMEEWAQWGRNFDQGVMCFFHSGVAGQPTQVNDCWPDTFGKMSDDATAVKHQTLVAITDASAMPVEVDGLNFGTINYADVLPSAGALLGVSSGRCVISPSDKVEDITINVAVEADGNYTLALKWARHTDAAVAYTCYVDDVSVSTGNLPSVNVFTTAATQAFSTTVALTAGNHKVRMHVPNASRADWVQPYQCILTAA